MKLLGKTKKDVDSDKNSENVPKLQSVYYQHTSKVLFSFVPNKQFGQLMNISPTFFNNDEYS